MTRRSIGSRRATGSPSFVSLRTSSPGSICSRFEVSFPARICAAPSMSSSRRFEPARRLDRFEHLLLLGVERVAQAFPHALTVADDDGERVVRGDAHQPVQLRMDAGELGVVLRERAPQVVELAVEPTHRGERRIGLGTPRGRRRGRPRRGGDRCAGRTAISARARAEVLLRDRELRSLPRPAHLVQRLLDHPDVDVMPGPADPQRTHHDDLGTRVITAEQRREEAIRGRLAR